MPRICKGRQKLQMVKMENETNLQVTFSKRRAGLFKKASELSTLCGTELGLIVFSPSKKAFCFGHLSIEAVLDKYEGRPSRQPFNHDMQQIVEACEHMTLNEINAELTQVMERIERERKRGEELTQLFKASQAECGLEGPVEELDMDKMEILRASLMEVRSKVADQAKQIIDAAKTANPAHLQGLANPEINNVGLNFNGNDLVMQAAEQPNNFGFNFSGAEPVLQAPEQPPNNFEFNFNGAEPLLKAPPDQHNNLGFNFNGAELVLRAPPDQPNNVGFNDDPNAMFPSDWNPNLGGGFL